MPRNKAVVLVLFVSGCAGILLGQWQPSQQLAVGPARTSWSNAWCVATTGETVYAVWSDTRDGKYRIYHKRSTDGGTVWGYDTRLSNGDSWSIAPSVACAGNAVHVVWQDNRDGKYRIHHQRSTDGGTVWGYDTRLSNGDSWSVAPSVACAGNTVHAVWQDTRDGNWEIYHKRSTDGGERWSSDTRLTSAEVPKFPSVAATGDTVHLVWYEEGPGGQVPEGIFYKRSTDAGESWSGDVRLTRMALGGSVSPSVAAVGMTVHVVWKDRRDGRVGIYYKRSTDAGESWSSDARLIAPVSTPECPSAAAAGNAVHVVWQDNRDGKYRIYHKRSTDGGTVWGYDTRLSNGDSWSMAPSVACAGNAVHVVWTGGNGEVIYKRYGRGNAGSIAGISFRDDDGDGERDAGEPGLPGWTVRLDPGPLYVLTGADGSFLFHSLPAGEYVVSEVVKTYWRLTYPPAPGTHVVTLAANQELTGNDFGNELYVFLRDLGVSVAGGRAVPGFPKTYSVRYENTGTVEIDATVTLTLPPEVSYVSSDPPGVYHPEAHLVTWHVGLVPAGLAGWLSATVEVAVVPIGTELTASVTIEPLVGDTNPGDNRDSEVEVVRGSFDPNMMTVRPDPYIQAGDVLDCTIYFQNVGNDTAFNIVVREMLDPGLDVSTVEPLAASHPYAFGLGAPNELVWFFNDIKLVDSVTNEPASHGFLRFRVRSKPGLRPGTTIDNSAAIYFDYNEPVATNTVRLTVVVLGWSAQESVPALPSGQAVGEGGWLAYNAGDRSIYAAKGNKTPDFYRYDPAEGTWHALSPWPDGTERDKPSYGSAGCADGAGCIYATKGNNTLGFWRYDAATDSWYQQADVPLGPNHQKVKGGTDMVWAGGPADGHAYLLKGQKNEFYRHHAVRDSWEELGSLPSGPDQKWDKGSWLAYDGVGTIYAHRAGYNELYAYDVSGGTWSGPRAGMPLVGRSGKKRASGDGGCGAYLNGAIYALKGGGTQEFWKYGIADNSWLELDSMPRGPEDRDVGAGADIAAAGLGLYITRGNGTNELWQYLSDELLPPRPPSGGGQAGLPVTGRPRLLVAPNPLTAGGATVLYHLPHVGAPTLSIYNVAGQRAMLRVLAGQRGCVSLDLGHLSNGVYLVKLSGAGFSATQKLVVHK